MTFQKGNTFGRFNKGRKNVLQSEFWKKWNEEHHETTKIQRAARKQNIVIARAARAVKCLHKLSNIDLHKAKAFCAICGSIFLKIQRHQRQGFMYSCWVGSISSHGGKVAAVTHLNQLTDMWTGKCNICERPIFHGRGTNHDGASLDHDHKTGKVRGWLCHGCNRGLGHYNENPALLRIAAEYLELRK